MVGPLHHSGFTHLLTFSDWLNKPINSKESSTDHDTLTCLMSAKMVNSFAFNFKDFGFSFQPTCTGIHT